MLRSVDRRARWVGGRPAPRRQPPRGPSIARASIRDCLARLSVAQERLPGVHEPLQLREELAHQRLPLSRRRSAPWRASWICARRVRSSVRVGLIGSTVSPPSCVAIAGAVALDELPADATILRGGDAAQDAPTDVQRLLDGALLVALVDQLALELLREAQVLAVQLAQRLLTDDRHQAPRFLTLGVAGVELVGQVTVVLPGAILADAVVHQARQGPQHVDGREDPAAMELAGEHDLSLGDVAGQVGDGMGDVVVRAW